MKHRVPPVLRRARISLARPCGCVQAVLLRQVDLHRRLLVVPRFVMVTRLDRATHERAPTGVLLVRVNRHEATVDRQTADHVRIIGRRWHVQANLRLVGVRNRRHRDTLAVRPRIARQRFPHRRAPIAAASRGEARRARGQLWLTERLVALLVLLDDLLDELQHIDVVAAVDDRPR